MRLRLIYFLAFFSLSLSIMAKDGENIIAASDSDTVPKKQGFIDKIINYFNESNKKKVGRKMDISFIGGPFYSSDSKFGVGLVAAGAYNTCPEDSMTAPSNMSLSFKATTAAHFELTLRGEHIFPHDRMRLNYEVNFASIDTKFWGVGYKQCSVDSNESRYKYLSSHAEAHFAWRIAPSVYIGPMVTFDYINARDFRKPELWAFMPSRTFNYSIGASFRYYTRDNLTAPKHGFFIRFDQSFAFRWMGNKYPYKANELTAACYFPLWKDATLASRLHWKVTWGRTQWGVMPYLGGSEFMRGYFEGRYRDKGAADLCVELRQHVWRRHGFVVWGGVGSVFPKVDKINFHELLPNFGVGYRWEFKKNMNVRLDVGFGKHEKGFFFNINEAF